MRLLANELAEMLWRIEKHDLEITVCQDSLGLLAINAAGANGTETKHVNLHKGDTEDVSLMFVTQLSRAIEGARRRKAAGHAQGTD